MEDQNKQSTSSEPDAEPVPITETDPELLAVEAEPETKLEVVPFVEPEPVFVPEAEPAPELEPFPEVTPEPVAEPIPELTPDPVPISEPLPILATEPSPDAIKRSNSSRKSL